MKARWMRCVGSGCCKATATNVIVMAVAATCKATAGPAPTSTSRASMDHICSDSCSRKDLPPGACLCACPPWCPLWCLLLSVRRRYCQLLPAGVVLAIATATATVASSFLPHTSFVQPGDPAYFVLACHWHKRTSRSLNLDTTPTIFPSSVISHLSRCSLVRLRATPLIHLEIGSSTDPRECRHHGPSTVSPAPASWPCLCSSAATCHQGQQGQQPWQGTLRDGGATSRTWLSASPAPAPWSEGQYLTQTLINILHILQKPRRREIRD